MSIRLKMRTYKLKEDYGWGQKSMISLKVEHGLLFCEFLVKYNGKHSKLVIEETSRLTDTIRFLMALQ